MRKAISLLLVASFLFPSVASSQPSPAQTVPSPGTPPPSVQPNPRSPGVFAPINPTRSDSGSLYGIQTRAIAGPDYRVGPGDVIDVQIVGRIDVNRQQVVVDPEGAIALPPLGTISVGGRTLLEANRLITARARAVFRFADVSLAVQTPRAFEAIVSGEVERPGTLQVTATHRLHEVILATGGVTPRGSVRHIQLTQNGVMREVDLLLFELKGDVSQNPFLQEGVRIHVPARRPAVTLQGAVRRPGE
jgi:protein involved in polysaccharide export with SLBB domain